MPLLSCDLTCATSWVRRRIIKLEARSRSLFSLYPFTSLPSSSPYRLYTLVACENVLFPQQCHRKRRTSPSDAQRGGEICASPHLSGRQTHFQVLPLHSLSIEHTPQLRYQSVLAVHHIPPVLSNRLIMLHVRRINPLSKTPRRTALISLKLIRRYTRHHRHTRPAPAAVSFIQSFIDSLHKTKLF